MGEGLALHAISLRAEGMRIQVDAAESRYMWKWP